MTLKWRAIFAFVLLIGAAIKTAPNFFSSEKSWWPAHGKIVYGLDIQGGVQLVMGVDIEAVMHEKMARTTRVMIEEFKNDAIKVKDVIVSDEQKNEIKVLLDGPEFETKAKELIEKNHNGFLQVMSTSSTEIICKANETMVNEMRKQVVDQAIGVIRNRIDEFGVSEPSISAQGDSRILVQLPGIKESDRAKELINRTARLEFKIVSTEMGGGKDHQQKLNEMITEAETAGSYGLGKDGMTYAAYIKRLNEDLKSKLPEHTVVSFEKAAAAKTIESGKIAYLLRTDTNVGGDLLEDAFVSYDERGSPQVAFRFGVEGARRFGEVTEANVGKLLAIVLDDVVQSAPVIQSKISGNGVINLNRGNQDETFKEAQFIAMTLRAGALPAALEQLEERTVGPTLGADSIAKAKAAGVVAFGAISAFLIGFYGWLGLIATVALGLNILCLLAVLTGLSATLTLPGIAGMILTMGMAVDANVIVFERIREEFRKGSSWKLAVQDGFGNAYSAIIDSNLVGAGVALILFYYGTGPVRGFAVTLVSGIVTSMFTAVFLSKVIIELCGDKVTWHKAIKGRATA